MCDNEEVLQGLKSDILYASEWGTIPTFNDEKGARIIFWTRNICMIGLTVTAALGTERLDYLWFFLPCIIYASSFFYRRIPVTTTVSEFTTYVFIAVLLKNTSESSETLELFLFDIGICFLSFEIILAFFYFDRLASRDPRMRLVNRLKQTVLHAFVGLSSVNWNQTNVGALVGEIFAVILFLMGMALLTIFFYVPAYRSSDDPPPGLGSVFLFSGVLLAIVTIIMLAEGAYKVVGYIMTALCSLAEMATVAHGIFDTESIFRCNLDADLIIRWVAFYDEDVRNDREDAALFLLGQIEDVAKRSFGQEFARRVKAKLEAKRHTHNMDHTSNDDKRTRANPSHQVVSVHVEEKKGKEEEATVLHLQPRIPRAA